MLDLSHELALLAAEKVIPPRAADRLIAEQTRAVFPIVYLVRILTWAGVSMFAAGVLMLLFEHVHRLGDETILFLLIAAAAACYLGAWRTRNSGARNVLLEYLPLLGALLLTGALSFAESRYHLLDAQWRWHLLILFLLHACAAYVLDSRRLVGLAVLALLGFVSVDADGAFWGDLEESAFDLLRSGAAVLLWRIAHQISFSPWRAFRGTLEMFAFHFLLGGSLLLTIDAHHELTGLSLLLGTAAAGGWWAFHRRDQSLMILAILYAAIGVEFVVMRAVSGDVAQILLLIALNLPLLFLLYRIRRSWSEA